jgi:hypothetical protein
MVDLQNRLPAQNVSIHYLFFRTVIFLVSISVYLLSLCVVVLLGFAAHRASLCSVRAVAELLGNGSAYMLVSFAKTALWTMAITLPLLWLWPAQAMLAQPYAFTLTALAGGFLFGLGAAVNGGCAFSTLAYLADGKLCMLATLAGFCSAIAGWHYLAGSMLIAPPQPLPLPMLMPGLLMTMLMSALWLWCGWEFYRLWRAREAGLHWHQRLCASHDRLSSAALLLGLSSGVLYTIHGSWTYTTVLKRSVDSMFGETAGLPLLLLLLGLALIAGMALSSWQRRSFQLRWGGEWPRHFTCGLLMGMGGAVIPGGNDELILRAIPLLSPHALPAFMAVLAGIACALWLLRVVLGKQLKIVCANDICRSIEA